MRRILTIVIPAALLAALLIAPSRAAAPAQVLDDALPVGWTGTDTSFVQGPEGTPSGVGGLKFGNLVSNASSPLTSFTVFDTWIYVPPNTTATLVMPWDWLPEYGYTLSVPLTSAPGWNHFTLSYGTPVTWTDATYGNSGVLTLGELVGCCIPSSLTRTEIKVTSTDGSAPWALLDTLTLSDGSTYDFEPVQQPTISTSTSTVVYGHSVTIGGAIVDGQGMKLAKVPASLCEKPQRESDFQLVDEDVSSSTGRLASEEVPARTTTYRWTSATGLTSEVRTVKVAPDVRAKIPTKVAKDEKLVVSGQVTPALPGLSVQLMRSNSKKALATAPLKKDGSYRFAVKAPRGTYLVSTRTAATTGFVAGKSQQGLVTVR